MKRKFSVLIATFCYCFGLTASAQITLLGSFNPTESSSVCGIAYDDVTDQLWVYGCSAATLQSYTSAGTFLSSFAIPGGSANDVDVETAPEQLTISNSVVPEGQVLFVNGESGVAEIYAVDNATGAIVQTLNTAFGSSHVVGGSYHPVRNTFFMVQDNVPSSTLENLIAEVDPVTGAVLQSFQITSFFSVSYGDIEVGANGNLFVVSSVESEMAEFTPAGAFVQMHALPAGVSSLSGIAIDCPAGEAWVSNTSGVIFHLGQFPGGGLLTPTISADGPTTFCKGGSVVLSVDPPGGLTYAWKKGSNFIDGATDATYEVKKSGNYSCLVSNACEPVLSNKISVTANPKPEAGFTQGACSGGAVLLTRTGTPTTGVTYKWKLNGDNIGGATNATYSATVTGSYKVEVKITATGCKKSSPEQLVTVNCKVGDIAPQFTAAAYPNPFSKTVTIKITGALQGPVTARLTDCYGRIIREYNDLVANSLFEIIEDLSPGVYFVQLNSDDVLIQTLKVLKTE